jgi:hypothetical protein
MIIRDLLCQHYVGRCPSSYIFSCTRRFVCWMYLYCRLCYLPACESEGPRFHPTDRTIVYISVLGVLSGETAERHPRKACLRQWPLPNIT